MNKTMNMKNIFTVVLLLFAGFSLVYLFTSGAQSPAWRSSPQGSISLWSISSASVDRTTEGG